MSVDRQPASGPESITNTSRYRYALHYLHVTNPETGTEVVFVPGELLPNWAVVEQAEHENQIFWCRGLKRPKPVGSGL